MNKKTFICRFCLEDKGMSVNLFDNNIVLNINLQSWINRTFGLKIDKDDGLPENVCISCILVVYQTYFFQKRCQESENILTQRIEVHQDAEFLISSANNDKKSNLVRDSSTESTVQGSSSSATHILKQNEVSSWACENSVDPISTNSTSDLLIQLGVEQNISPNNKALPETCFKSCQQQQQELEVVFICEISHNSNSHNGRNKSGTPPNYSAEPKQFHTCESQNSPSSSELLPSEIEECALNRHLGFHKDYKKQEEPSLVSVDEPSKERRDKKSEFYLEFVKFVNSNVCQSNVLTGMNEEIHKLNRKRERIISQGINPKELFNSIQNQGKEKAMVRDKSHLSKKYTNTSSMTLGKVKSNIQLNADDRKPTMLTSSVRNMAYSSKYAIKSVPENLAHACSTLEETLHPSTLEENYSKSVGSLNVCDVSVKMDGVTFEQSPITVNDGIGNTHTKQCPATSEEKMSFFKGNTMSGTTSLRTPIKKNGHTSIKSGDKRVIEKENNENDHSCVKIAKIMIDQDLCGGLPSVLSKDSKKNMTKQSLSSIKSYNLEPECFQAVLSSPCRKLPLSPEKSNEVKELATKPDTFSRLLSRKLFSPHRRSFSHSDQILQCVLAANQSIKSLEQENEQSTNEKNENYFMDDSTKCSRIIGNSESSLQLLQGMRHTIRGNVYQPTSRASMHEKPITVNPASGACEGQSILMEGESHGKKGDNIVSMGHEASDDLQFLKHQSSLGKSDVTASIKETMKVKVGISSVIEGVTTEKSQISSSSQVSCIQLETPTEDVSNFGKQNSGDMSGQNTDKKLLNHDSSSPTRTYHESLTQGDSVMQIPSVSVVQSPNAMANDNLFSKHVECMGDRKNSSESTSTPQNSNSLSKKKKRKRNSRAKKAKMSMYNFNKISFTFPCPVCFKAFSNHGSMLQHQLTHNKRPSLEVESPVNFAQLKIGIRKSQGNSPKVNKSPIGQQQVSKLKTFNAVGPVRDEKIDEIRGIIQQHLLVNSGSSNGGCKSFRCPACFKLIPDWYEVTMHIVLDHDSLSSEWPMSFLFTPEIFRKLVCNESNVEDSIIPVVQPGITTVKPLIACDHCFKQFYSKSALLKHLIWAHDKSLSGLNQ